MYIEENIQFAVTLFHLVSEQELYIYAFSLHLLQIHGKCKRLFLVDLYLSYITLNEINHGECIEVGFADHYSNAI